MGTLTVLHRSFDVSIVALPTSNDEARNGIEPPENTGAFWAGSRELDFLATTSLLGEFQLLTSNFSF